tara:strand:- start:729 stop:1034 length:306 start_codon:yes stop_codon:yes gene_type:complete
MHPKKAKKLLAAGHMTQDEYNEIVATYQAKQAEAAELQKAEEWYSDLEKANYTTKKNMIKDKALDLSVKAGLMEDRQESKRVGRKASNLRYSLRGSGGMSF